MTGYELLLWGLAAWVWDPISLLALYGSIHMMARILEMVERYL